MSKLTEMEKIVESVVNQAVKEIFTESIKKDVSFKLGSKEMKFGSREHVAALKAILRGLQALRDCYNTGSANRHVYSSACHKIRKLIAKHDIHEQNI